MDTLFDPNAPHCEALKTVSSIAYLAATKSASITADALKGKTLRFLYKPDIPHESIIAAYVISQLALAGIDVHPIPVDKDGYNSLNCGRMALVYHTTKGATIMSTTRTTSTAATGDDRGAGLRQRAGVLQPYHHSMRTGDGARRTTRRRSST